MSRLLQSVIAAAAFTACQVFPAQAGQSWIGGGGNNNWTNGANWSPSGSPTSGSTADLFFANSNGNYNSYNDYLGWVSWRNIDFNAAYPFVLTSAPTASVDLYGRIYNGSGNTASCSFANIALQANTQFCAYGGALAIDSPNIYTNGFTLLLSASGSPRGVILGNSTVISGNGTVRVDSAALVSIKANQAYTGNTEINSGKISLEGGAIGSSSVIYLGNGGASYGNLNAVLSVAGSTSLGNRVVVNKADTGSGVGSGYRILEFATDANLVLSCPIELNGRIDLRNGVYPARSGEITGNITNGSDTSANVSRDVRVNYNYSSAGAIKLSGNNSYTGNTEICAGILRIGSATAIPYGANKGNLTISGGTLDMNGFNVNLNGLYASNSNCVVDNLNSSATDSYELAFGYNNVTGGGFFQGTIKNTYGTISVRKVGTGNLNFYGVKNYAGNTTIDDGTLSLGGTDSLPHGAGKGNIYVNSAGMLNLNTANPTVNGLWGSGTIDNLSGGGSYTLAIGDNDQTSTFSGRIRNNLGSLNINKIGNGRLTLSGVNSYSGSTTVASGTLTVNGTHTGAGNYAINAGYLNGGGVITLSGANAVTVNNAAVVAPGSSVGLLTINGAFNLAANQLATIEVEVGGSPGQPGVSFDQLVVTGALTINGGRLDVIPLPNVQLLTEYKIISTTSYNPTNNVFGKLNEMIGSNNYTNAYNTYRYSLRYAANDGIYVTFSSVPEPVSGGILVLTYSLLRRRNRACLAIRR